MVKYKYISTLGTNNMDDINLILETRKRITLTPRSDCYQEVLDNLCTPEHVSIEGNSLVSDQFSKQIKEMCEYYDVVDACTTVEVE